MKNKKAWIVIGVIVLAFGGCFGDRYIAYALVDYYCEKDAGSFIYEKVALDSTYFMPIPKEIIKQDARFTFGEVMIDLDKFNEKYHFEYIKSELVSSIGPVRYIRTSVVRKKDNKVLGEAISVSTRGGWLNNLAIPVPAEAYGCPDGRDEDRKFLYYKHHRNLITNVFKLKN